MVKLLSVLFLVASIVAPHDGMADIGPKPHFEIFFDDTIATDSKPKLLTCEKSTCEDKVPFREIGPQRFDCSGLEEAKTHSCYAMAYGFSPFLTLRIQNKGRVYESEPFVPGGDIDATLKDGKLVLKKRWISRLFCFWWCW